MTLGTYNAMIGLSPPDVTRPIPLVIDAVTGWRFKQWPHLCPFMCSTTCSPWSLILYIWRILLTLAEELLNQLFLKKRLWDLWNMRSTDFVQHLSQEWRQRSLRRHKALQRLVSPKTHKKTFSQLGLIEPVMMIDMFLPEFRAICLWTKMEADVWLWDSKKLSHSNMGFIAQLFLIQKGPFSFRFITTCGHWAKTSC